MPEEGLKGASHTVHPHEPLEIAVLASRPLEERAIGARWVGEHGTPHQGEEGRVALFHATTKSGVSLTEGDRVAE